MMVTVKDLLVSPAEKFSVPLVTMKSVPAVAMVEPEVEFIATKSTVTAPALPLVRNTVMVAAPTLSSAVKLVVLNANCPRRKSSSTMVNTAVRWKPSAGLFTTTTWPPSSKLPPPACGPVPTPVAKKLSTAPEFSSSRSTRLVLAVPLNEPNRPTTMSRPLPSRTRVRTVLSAPLPATLKLVSSAPLASSLAMRPTLTLLTAVNSPPMNTLLNGSKATVRTEPFGPAPALKVKSSAPTVLRRTRRVVFGCEFSPVKSPPTMRVEPLTASARTVELKPMPRFALKRVLSDVAFASNLTRRRAVVPL